jgi:hypothetical protein
MSLVNDLIRRAKARPMELTINNNHVGTLAAHARACSWFSTGEKTLEELIRAGKMRFMGIPVRVLGTDGQSDADKRSIGE